MTRLFIDGLQWRLQCAGRFRKRGIVHRRDEVGLVMPLGCH